MGNTEDILNDVRRRIDAHAGPLTEARTRLRLARAKAGAFPGARRTYASGSIPQNTFIHPVDDGDGGVVLDRRTYPELGPEGGGASPTQVTRLMCAFLGSTVREVYPKARCTTSKRGPKILFGRPVDGQDPTVDMVIATHPPGGRRAVDPQPAHQPVGGVRPRTPRRAVHLRRTCPAPHPPTGDPPAQGVERTVHRPGVLLAQPHGVGMGVRPSRRRDGRRARRRPRRGRRARRVRCGYPGSRGSVEERAAPRRPPDRGATAAGGRRRARRGA